MTTLLHVFATFGAGGPQVRATQLVARLGPGFTHAIVAMDGNTDAARMLPAPGSWRLLPAPPRAGFLASVAAQTRLLRELRPDLVLTYNWGAIETVAACRRLRLPLVHHEDGFLPDEVQRRLWRRNWFRRFLLRKVPVIVPSSVLQDIARREWRLRAADVHWLPNGVDLERFAPAPAGAGDAVPVVGTVGGLRPEKDQATLLAAFARLRVPARLLLVGDGALRAALQRQAGELGIADRVEFAGAQPDPAPWYRRMDVFVLSSRTEQMPLSLLEAMASGLPVVATDVGDVRRMLPDAAAGGIVPAGEAEALAVALAALLGDADRRRREGLANRARCEQRYGLATCLDRFTAVYRAALR